MRYILFNFGAWRVSAFRIDLVPKPDFTQLQVLVERGLHSVMMANSIVGGPDPDSPNFKVSPCPITVPKCADSFLP